MKNTVNNFQLMINSNEHIWNLTTGVDEGVPDIRGAGYCLQKKG